MRGLLGANAAARTTFVRASIVLCAATLAAMASAPIMSCGKGPLLRLQLSRTADVPDDATIEVALNGAHVATVADLAKVLPPGKVLHLGYWIEFTRADADADVPVPTCPRATGQICVHLEARAKSGAVLFASDPDLMWTGQTLNWVAGARKQEAGPDAGVGGEAGRAPILDGGTSDAPSSGGAGGFPVLKGGGAGGDGGGGVDAGAAAGSGAAGTSGVGAAGGAGGAPWDRGGRGATGGNGGGGGRGAAAGAGSGGTITSSGGRGSGGAAGAGGLAAAGGALGGGGGAVSPAGGMMGSGAGTSGAAGSDGSQGSPGLGGGPEGGAPGAGGGAGTLGGAGGAGGAAGAGGQGGQGGTFAANCANDPTGLAVCTCADYCAAVSPGGTCSNRSYFPEGDTDCLATCTSFKWGQAVLSNLANALSCRIHFAYTSPLCNGVGPPGGNVCGTDYCHTLCSAVVRNCPGALSPYASPTDCLTSCSDLAPAPTETLPDERLARSGNTYNCRLYWAAQAGRPGTTADQTIACTNAGIASPACK